MVVLYIFDLNQVNFVETFHSERTGATYVRSPLPRTMPGEPLDNVNDPGAWNLEGQFNR